MTLLRVFCVGMSVAFAALCVWAFGADHFSQAFSDIWQRPWGKVAMADLYFGFCVVSIIVFLSERRTIALPVIAATFVLGNVVPALWLCWRLPKLAKQLGR